MCGRNVAGQLGLGDPSSFPVNERGHQYQVPHIVTSLCAIRLIIPFEYLLDSDIAHALTPFLTPLIATKLSRDAFPFACHAM